MLLVLGVVVLPLHSLTASYADSIEELEFRLAKLRKLAAGKEAWTARLEEIRQQGQQEERFFARDTTALASADLQTLIKQTVTDAGGELISTQVIPERKEEQFSRVAVKVRMTGSTPVLRQVLHAFEANTPILFVENLNIRPIRVGQPFSPGGKPAAKATDKLSVDFDVVGYMRGVN
ncbi:type II secretion system protein GspM [Methylococcus sp. EFPC2]|uniref:type II secretion system protein GspM n=1 Tax=Methylococcus sp. EFPC2 TaxID=2812648 RepID=UPI001F07B0BE|nr:type II secretion system protein GspM [Methylococcus sp. EFPC2]